MDATDLWDDEAADVLDRAADILEERGHTKGALEDQQGRVCLLGSVCAALSGSPYDCGEQNGLIWNRIIRSLASYLVIPRYDLAYWNNLPEREPFEVVDACRHTAKVLRGG